MFSSATMSDANPRKRASILSLWNHAGLSQREIARRLDVNQQSTVSGDETSSQNWVSNATEERKMRKETQNKPGR